MFEEYQKPTSVFAEFEADSVQNRMFVYTIETLSVLPIA